MKRIDYFWPQLLVAVTLPATLTSLVFDLLGVVRMPGTEYATMVFATALGVALLWAGLAVWVNAHREYRKKAAPPAGVPLRVPELNAALYVVPTHSIPMSVCVNETDPVLHIASDGTLYWRGREVTTDDELRLAMADLATTIKVMLHPSFTEGNTDASTRKTTTEPCTN